MRVCFVAAFALIALSGALAQTQKGATISGIVKNRASGEPVRKAVVNVLDKDDAFGTAITDSNGRFLFSDLPPGDYRVRVNREGFERIAYGSRGPNRPGRIITLSEGEARRDIVISLQPLGVITGVVLDEAGDPLSQAQIELFQHVYSRGKQRLGFRNSANTNERGEYRIFNVAPGRYYVMARADAVGPVVFVSSRAAAGPPAAMGVVGQQFFPGADDISAAQIVAPLPGKETRGIDFRLRVRQTVQLRGKLALPGEASANGQWDVQAILPDLPSWFAHGSGGQLPQDTFEDSNLAPAKYMLVAHLTAGGKQYRGVQVADLTNGVEQQVTIPVQPAVDLSGVIQVEGTGAEKLRHFHVTLAPGDDVPLNRAGESANTKDDLHFTLASVFPGVWDINVSPIPSGGYIKAMYLGDQDVLTEDMVIGPKSPTLLKIVLSTEGVKLEGDVDGDALKDGARASIIVAPTGKFSRVLSFYHLKTTDAKGHFNLNGLRPGAYSVYAFVDVAPDAYQDPEFLKPFAKWAVPVELRHGQTASAKPRLIPANATGGGQE